MATADLQPIVPALAAAYQKQTGVRIAASFGSPAAVTAKLEHGDREDVFLSSDYVHPEQLVAAGLAAGQPTEYARAVLVLWARKDSAAQPLSLASLTSPRVTRIAAVDGLEAPFGLAAARALGNLGVTDKTAAKLVVTRDVAQAAELAASGQAQAGILSLTIALSPRFRNLGTYVRLPGLSYPPIFQCAVVLKSSKDQAAARLFVNWLTSYEVQHNLPAFGLDPVQ